MDQHLKSDIAISEMISLTSLNTIFFKDKSTVISLNKTLKFT